MSRYAAVVLAAGQGTRFVASGGTAPSKLVAELNGTPLVRHAVEAALASKAEPVVVVIGHAGAAVEAALAGLFVRTVHNPDYETGLASSLKVGIGALPASLDGAIILLGDMPMITVSVIDALIAEAEAAPEADAIVPVLSGHRANPVLLGRTLFALVANLQGDAGARHLLRQTGIAVREVETGHVSTVTDIDEISDFDRLLPGACKGH